jgi:fructosamine-3-kinase
MKPTQIDQIQHILQANIVHHAPLRGGNIGTLYRLSLDDKRTIVAKTHMGAGGTLDIEGWMLTYLAEHSDLPVPNVLHSEASLLLMQYIEGKSHFSNRSEQDAARLLAHLHSLSAPQFGLERDTLIGGLHQPNTLTSDWLTFFREYRLHYMAQQAYAEQQLPKAMLIRLERFLPHLDRWLLLPTKPALLHGDVWTTNVLAQDGQISAFLDPAIYYGHPEIELAFTTLFGTFGTPFFDAYQQIHPIPAGFFEERRDIYNLYPLLVHVRLFGGGYVGQVGRILERFGY